MCKLPDAVTNSEVDDLQERTERYIDHSLQYACKSWHKHLSHVYTVPAHMLNTLHQFLKEKFVFWLEVLSILGACKAAVDALRVAAEKLEVCCYILDSFPEFAHPGPRGQFSTSSVIAPDLLLDFLSPLVYLLYISITQPYPYPPKHQLCGVCMDNMLIPW